MEKISVISMDLFIILQRKLQIYSGMPLLYSVILSYLVLETILYSKEHFKNILEAYLRTISMSLGLLRVFLDKLLEPNTSFLQE